nr:hypothetical protein [Sinimarinibacterium sp. NLF-5-8]
MMKIKVKNQRLPVAPTQTVSAPLKPDPCAAHRIVPKAQNAIPLRAQKRITHRIACAIGVLPAIQLNHQALRQTNKVNDVRANRLLPLELEPQKPPRPQLLPQRVFRIRLPPAQCFGMGEDLAGFVME